MFWNESALYNVYRLDVTDNGLAAIVRLSNGDMRKGLNILQVCMHRWATEILIEAVSPSYVYWCFCILQSTHMACPNITEEAVYLCTGSPLPKDVEQMAYWLLNESFAKASTCILYCKVHRFMRTVCICIVADDTRLWKTSSLLNAKLWD